MKTLLTAILAALAKVYIQCYKPIIIGITGSVGKTSAKEAVFSVVRKKYRVRRSLKNYNTEIGVPLTILGMPHSGKNIFGWLWSFAKAYFYWGVADPNYPEVLVLEMGADRPGDIQRLTEIAPPFIGIVTAIGEIPVHVEFFAGPEEVAREKGTLIKAVAPEGYAILNSDDDAVLDLKSLTNAHPMTFGFGEDADVRIAKYGLHHIPRGGALTVDGISLELKHGEKTAELSMKNAFGKQQAYAAAAAAAAGLVMGLDLPEISEALAAYEPPPGRLKLIRGNKDTLILDDTYNASPAAVHAALDVLKEFPARRRVAVLGDMLELGRFTESAHEAIGERVAGVADLFVAVGERMKFAAEEAVAAGIENRKQLRPDQVLRFDRAEDVGEKLEELMQPGDVILVKGSQSMRMEKVVAEIMAEPERRAELLVRQDPEWRRKR